MPGVSATRQRAESTSSNGSWQVVTETGSIDSLMNGSYMMQFVSQRQPDANAAATGAGANSASSGSTLNGSNTPSNASNASHGSSSGLSNGALNGLTNAINDKDMLSRATTMM